ncbi:MAG TPA: MarR family transcriptional regulator [Ignavibacteria bacterium]|nr:MarR family transcriptional regulator [Ignavibacteria bacterium]HRF66280.1 MarR family transcriptional regulator [Ignavibacteria bacterium]
MKTDISHNMEFFNTLGNSLKQYRKLVNAKLEHFGIQITLDQWQVLDIIVNFAHITQAEIAAKTSKDTASITRIIGILNSKGWVARQTDPENRRKLILKVSHPGEKEYYRAAEVISKFSIAAVEGIKEKRLRKLKKIFKTITKNCE